jgi:uncharacterized protein
VRIVLDTNVVLSALLWRGTPYRLLDAIRQRSSTQLYSSATLLEELADILTRPSATKRLALIDKTAATVLADYVEVIELVAPPPCRGSCPVISMTIKSSPLPWPHRPT